MSKWVNVTIMFTVSENEVARMEQGVFAFVELIVGKPDSPVLVKSPRLLALKGEAVTTHPPCARPVQSHQCFFPISPKDI